jgi:hypothetical protein
MKNYDRINALGVRFRKGTRVRDIETVDKGKETLATGPAKTGVTQPLLKNAFTTFKDASWVPPRWSFGPSSHW